MKSALSWPLTASLLVAAQTASAHLVSTGLGPVYDGIWHFALTPEQFLPMAALALLAGLRGPSHARRVLFFLPPAWLVGSLAGFALPPAVSPLAEALALLVAGVLLASDAKFPPSATVGLSLVLGLVLGAVYRVPEDADTPALLSTGVGACVCVFALSALLSSVSLPMRAPAAKIAVRVGGSWMAALGLLLVGWWIHGQSYS
jgi:urease accessory protein